jgi:hypothetical protein
MVYIMVGDCGAIPTHVQVKGSANLSLSEADPTQIYTCRTRDVPLSEPIYSGS